MKINRTTVGAERAISLLPAKPILAVLLSVLLIVSLFPMIQPAYGEGAFDAPVSDVADTAIDGELSDELAPEEDAVEGVEDDAAATEAAEGDGSADESTLGGDGDSDDPAAEALAAEADVDESQVGESAALSDWNGDQSNANNLVVEGEKIANLRYTNGGTYTLTVNGTLKGTVYVTGGTTLTINGTGTINGNGAPTVIHVEGGGSVLNINKDDDDVLKITGGAGGTKLNDAKSFPDYFGGGGILVQRKDGEGASLNLYNGKVYNNWAGAGGGIYIDRDCSFYMANGEVSGNRTQAQTRGGESYPAREAGGIYVAGHSVRGASDVLNNANYTYIAKAAITGNHTETTIDWGGGGIFIESQGALKLGTALITKNTANGLGGGISGCPHASIGIGKITEGFSLYGNTAKREEWAWPDNTYLDSLTVSYNGKTYEAGDKWAKADPGFTADKAMDYYCTNVSYIAGYDGAAGSTVAWTGRAAGSEAYDRVARDIAIYKGDSLTLPGESLGLTSTKPAGDMVTGRDVVITDNTSTTHGGGIGCNGTLMIGDLPSGDQYSPLSLEVKKEYMNSAGEALEMEEGSFSFELRDEKGNVVATTKNDKTGAVLFSIDGESVLKGIAPNKAKELTYTIHEVPSTDDPEGPTVTYADDVKVTLSVKHQVQSIDYPNVSLKVTYHDPILQSIKVDKASYDNGATSDRPLTLTNRLQLEGAWAPEALKFYYGDAQQPVFDFVLQELRDPGSDLGNVDLIHLVRKEGVALQVQNGPFDGTRASVAFPTISYMEAGTYWYKIFEQSGADPTVYVVKVLVIGDKDGVTDANGKPVPSTALAARVAEVYYAESMDATELTKLTADEVGNLPTPEFHNNDEAFSLAGYRVNALSGAPVSQKCLVDPKIIKQLEGRTLTPGEFSFQLIEVNDYADTTGTVISETSNDADGMVDFDAAANKADPGWEPSCLLFTQPGLYKYRVIEDPKQKGDPSIDYSQQVITFTVQVELNDGVLAATDMYYGYLNEAGENVRYKEQYTDWELKEQDPAWSPSINDYADLDTSWHPTMTNRAKPMDLAVRKTSVLDRTEGLEGATYALYLANFGGEGDIRLANATSDDEGWLYFEDVALKTGNLYYFMEEAAPEGHTVSKFRSKYFYLVPDAAAPNGYVMKYTDSRDALDGSDDLVAQVAGGAEGDDTFGGNEAAPDVDGTTTEPVTGKDGALLFVYEADGGVYDEATYVEFNKLDTHNHEWVEGAKLSIVEKESGRVVNAWVSGKAPEVLQKALNVDTVYVLREDEAPEGYEKAADVEFRIDSFGAVEILSGTENGNAELTGSTIVLYDTRIPVEEVVTETRERVRELPSTGPKTADKLAKTGDAVPLFAVGLVALAALVVLVAAARRNRKRGNHAR